MADLALVVAYAVPGRVIGDGERMPWHHPADLRHFRAVTTGHAVIMGRRTWASIGRPLPGRRNLVLSRDASFAATGAEVFAGLPEAIAAARTGGDACPMVIGGGTVYAQALPLATVLHLTEVHEAHAGSVVFPAIDEGAWSETSRRADGPLLFRTLVRR
ncbi:MAG: dihydrofolate reductase [Planctomycetes bacterium]|nr:dihydrofolate reductase [Planctomycetota bacterium]